MQITSGELKYVPSVMSELKSVQTTSGELKYVPSVMSELKSAGNQR